MEAGAAQTRKLWRMLCRRRTIRTLALALTLQYKVLWTGMDRFYSLEWGLPPDSEAQTSLVYGTLLVWIGVACIFFSLAEMAS